MSGKTVDIAKDQEKSKEEDPQNYNREGRKNKEEVLGLEVQEVRQKVNKGS